MDINYKSKQFMIKHILEDIDFKLSQCFSLPEVDFGIYDSCTMEPVFVVGNKYIVKGNKENPWIYTLENVGLFLKHKVLSIEGDLVYKPGMPICMNPIATPQAIYLVNQFINSISQYVFRPGYSKEAVMDEFLLKFYPGVKLHLFGLVETTPLMDRWDYIEELNEHPVIRCLETIYKLVYNMFNRDLNDYHYYECHFSDGVLWLFDLGDYRIIEWEIMKKQLEKEPDRETSITSVLEEIYPEDWIYLKSDYMDKAFDTTNAVAFI